MRFAAEARARLGALSRAGALAMGLTGAFAGTGAAAALEGCAPHRALCGTSATAPACSGDTSCLAGVCVPPADVPTRTSLRVVARPVAMAWVRRGSESRPAIAQLGGEHGGRLFLRFSVTALDADRLIAAELVLSSVPIEAPLSEGVERALSLRAKRVVDAWDEDAISWVNQPRTFDLGLPPVRIINNPRGASDARVRIDVRAIVSHWPRRDPSDQGIAVDGEGAPPIEVALATLGPDVAGGLLRDGPELELYFSAARREDLRPPNVPR